MPPSPKYQPRSPSRRATDRMRRCDASRVGATSSLDRWCPRTNYPPKVEVGGSLLVGHRCEVPGPSPCIVRYVASFVGVSLCCWTHSQWKEISRLVWIARRGALWCDRSTSARGEGV